jgi:hypothetical protein
MGQVNDWIPAFVYLVEYKVTEQADDVPITGFGPPRFVTEAVNNIRQTKTKATLERRTPGAR